MAKFKEVYRFVYSSWEEWVDSCFFMGEDLLGGEYSYCSSGLLDTIFKANTGFMHEFFFELRVNILLMDILASRPRYKRFHILEYMERLPNLINITFKNI